MKTTNISLCAQCGSSNPTERDHVPPKTLFLEPRPSNLITTPICSSCHLPTSMDDEYFRDMLVFNQDVKDNIVVKELTKKVFRGLSRPQKKKSLSALWKNIQKVEVQSPMGLYLGTGAMFTIKKERFERVITRTVKGIYYYFEGTPLSKDSRISSYLLDAIDFRKYNGSNMIINQLANSPEVIIENQTFRFRRYYNVQEKYEVWLLVFYNVFETLTFIVHSEEKNKV